MVFYSILYNNKLTPVRFEKSNCPNKLDEKMNSLKDNCISHHVTLRMPKNFRMPSDHTLSKDAASLSVPLSQYKESYLRRRGAVVNN